VDQPAAASTTLASHGIAGVVLRADFLWQHDRYGHRIVAIHDQLESTLLVTEPGGQWADWPAGPPLQQLSWTETVPGRRVGLLLGMAGKSHWSVSAEVVGDSGDLLFDVACRIQQPPRWLGSTYQSGCPVRRETPYAACLSAGGANIRLTTEPVGNVPRATIEVQGRRLAIGPDVNSVCAPQTVRWKYRIAIQSYAEHHDR
jgi:hypothetical protein